MKLKTVLSRLLLLLVGLTPFLFGGLLNWASYAVDFVLPWGWINLLFVLVWAAFAFLFARFAKSTAQTVILLNLPAFLVLVLLGCQLLVRQAYWSNWLGLWTQYFYLPLMRWGSVLTSWSHTVFPVYCCAFVLMIAASLLGSVLFWRGSKGRSFHGPSGDPHSGTGNGTILDEYLFR